MTDPTAPTPDGPTPDGPTPDGQSTSWEEPHQLDVALRAAVLELDRHAAASGWDQPARLFALVHTEALLAEEPGLVDMLGVDPTMDLTGSLTPVEQEPLPTDRPLEELLTEMTWPAEVHGCGVIVERLVLPPTVALPEDVGEAQQVAATHPERTEVRMTAAATRSGSTYAALRLRDHDDELHVVEGADLVPALLELLQATLAPTDPLDPSSAGASDGPEQ